MQNPNMLSTLSTGTISSGGAQNIKPFSNSNIFSWPVYGSQPDRVSPAPSIEFPFGPGHEFLTTNNGLVRRLVGGWQAVVSAVLHRPHILQLGFKFE
jgi:hypothetical protein